MSTPVLTLPEVAALLRVTPGLTLDVVPFHIARAGAQSFTDAEALTLFPRRAAA